MTDLPLSETGTSAVPSRIGARGLLDDRGLVVEIDDIAEPLLRHGVLRSSVIMFLADVSAGVTLDDDPDSWSFTSDLSLRMAVRRAPAKATATTFLLRGGRRSAQAGIEVVDGDGAFLASGAIGFTKTARKPGDPPKPEYSPAQVAERFDGRCRLVQPIREEAGIRPVDPAAGVVEIDIRPEVCNPAGTLQGAMVALVAEAAAEDLVEMTSGRPSVVSDLDIRYLARTAAGPVRTQSRLLGPGPDDAVEVRLTDLGTGVLTTLVYARVRPVALQ